MIKLPGVVVFKRHLAVKLKTKHTHLFLKPPPIILTLIPFQLIK